MVIAVWAWRNVDRWIFGLSLEDSAVSKYRSWRGGWEGPGVCLDALEKRIISCPRQGSNLDSSAGHPKRRFYATWGIIYSVAKFIERKKSYLFTFLLKVTEMVFDDISWYRNVIFLLSFFSDVFYIFFLAKIFRLSFSLVMAVINYYVVL